VATLYAEWTKVAFTYANLLTFPYTRVLAYIEPVLACHRMS